MSKHRKISGQFAPRTIEMLRSPAYRALSLSAHRILAHIEIELASHGGRDNGKLPVTFTNFEQFGISDRHTISRGIRELCVLGFVEQTRRGRAGNGEFRTPNLFRLTYLSAGGKAPTHEWRRIKTTEQAEKIARKAKHTIKRKKFTSGENHTGTGVKNHTGTSGENHTVAPRSPVVKTTPLSRQGLAISPSGPLNRGTVSQDNHHQAPRRGARAPADDPMTFHRTNRRRNSHVKN